MAKDNFSGTIFFGQFRTIEVESENESNCKNENKCTRMTLNIKITHQFTRTRQKVVEIVDIFCGKKKKNDCG